MARFIVFDVETPNRKNNRISAIGITVVEEGKISKEFYSLVNPEADFDYFNVKLTGISKSGVKDAPTFPELWQQIEPLFSDGMLVAHNASFDMNVLKNCLLDYEIDWKPYARYLCTVKMGRSLFPDRSHKLNMVCEHFGIPLNHHRADSDSRACAEILLRYLKAGAEVKDFIRTCSFKK
ncbi:3'-5' exonuclease [Oribacterium sinus]